VHVRHHCMPVTGRAPHASGVDRHRGSRPPSLSSAPPPHGVRVRVGAVTGRPTAAWPAAALLPGVPGAPRPNRGHRGAHARPAQGRPWAPSRTSSRPTAPNAGGCARRCRPRWKAGPATASTRRSAIGPDELDRTYPVVDTQSRTSPQTRGTRRNDLGRLRTFDWIKIDKAVGDGVDRWNDFDDHRPTHCPGSSSTCRAHQYSAKPAT
jgi:hypothetical protein